MAGLQHLSLFTLPHKIHISRFPHRYGLMPRRERKEEEKIFRGAFAIQAQMVPKKAGPCRELGAGRTPVTVPLPQTLAVPPEKTWERKLHSATKTMSPDHS